MGTAAWKGAGGTKGRGLASRALRPEIEFLEVWRSLKVC